MTKWVTTKLGEGGFVDFVKGEQINGELLSAQGQFPMFNGGIEPSGYLDKYNTDANQIIMSEGGNSCGYINYIEEKFWRGGHCYLVKFKDETAIEKQFFYYLLKYHEENLMKLRVGSGLPNIQKKDVFKYTITYPESLAEQRRIAGILSSADGAIAASEALIEKYRNIKRGLLATLLQPKEGWKKVKLGECCEVNPKTDLSILRSNDEIAFLKMEDVSNDGKITNCNYLRYCFLAKKGFTTFQNEDVIFAKITPCMENGKGALIRNIKSIVGMGSTEFHVLRAKENISIDFIYQISISKHFRLEAEMQMTGSAGQQRVPTAFLEEYEISVPYKNGQPDLTEQRRIAEILSSVDAKIAAEEKVVEKYKGVKKGLMEEMMGSEK